MLVIATDCASTVKHVKEIYKGPSKVINREINLKCAGFASVQITHENRSLNVEAHMLARATTTLVFGRPVCLSVRPDFIVIPSNILTE